MSRFTRTLIGAGLCLVLVGEPTVGIASGLYTIPGFIVLGTMYVLLFLLYEALVSRYKLSNIQLLLLNFAVYSVLVTGLLHGEFMEYIQHPENTFIISLIRIQAACFPVFVFVLMNRFFPKQSSNKSVSLAKVLWGCLAYVLILSPTKAFGLVKMNETLQAVPNVSLGYIIAAIIACVVAFSFSVRKKQPVYVDKNLVRWSIVLLVLGAVPFLPSFIVLVFLVPIITAVYIAKPDFRRALVATPK